MTGDTDGSSSKRRQSSRYSAFVGLAFIALIVIAAINTFESNEGGVLGADESQVGEPLPEFAVPCETSEVPCPADEQRTPACEVDVPNVIRICDLFDRPLVLSFWFSTPAECPPTQDVVDNAARRYGTSL